MNLNNSFPVWLFNLLIMWPDFKPGLCPSPAMIGSCLACYGSGGLSILWQQHVLDKLLLNTPCTFRLAHILQTHKCASEAVQDLFRSPWDILNGTFAMFYSVLAGADGWGSPGKSPVGTHCHHSVDMYFFRPENTWGRAECEILCFALWPYFPGLAATSGEVLQMEANEDRYWHLTLGQVADSFLKSVTGLFLKTICLGSEGKERRQETPPILSPSTFWGSNPDCHICSPSLLKTKAV